MDFKEKLFQQAQSINIDLSDMQLKLFEVYYYELIEKNKVMNLTAITDEDEVIVKHFIDSLLLYDEKYFSGIKTFCDVGTGAGFPGLPIKIYKDKMTVLLMDSLAKRLKFLDELINKLDLKNIDTCHIRAEDAGNDDRHRGNYGIVTARAVAQLSVLSEYCLPLVQIGGFFIAMKAKKIDVEITEAKKAISILGGKIIDIKKIILPQINDERTIVFIQKVKDTPCSFPRRNGLLNKRPIK